MDAMWLHTSPVERVFFFDHGDVQSDAVLSNLEGSLSEALCAFYPLAGRLRLVPGAPKRNRYELHYRPGGGVSFTIAEYLRDDVGLYELAADEPTELGMVTPLVPPLPGGGAVLALQATVLRRGGLALGLAVHHAACDGACSTHFLHTWVAAARHAGEPAPEPPVIGRGFVRNRDDLYDAFAAPRPYSDDARRILKSDADDKLLATFTLSAEHLQGIAYQCCGVSPPPPRCTSSIVAAYGFIWQCHYRAKHSSGSGGAGGESAYIVFPTDHRARLDPPVPDKYLGNCVGLCFGSASKADLLSPGAAGLLAECSAVGTAVDDAVRRGPDGFWDGCLERVVEAFGAGDVPLTVAGSPRFRVYGVDFGFGTAAKVSVVSVARTGAMSVAEARGGSGGVEVGISLPPDGMRRFRRCFADADAFISSAS